MAKLLMEHELVKRKAAIEPPDIGSEWEGGDPYLYLRLVGLQASDPIQILKRVKLGLKFHALERFQENTQFSTADLAHLVSIKMRTWHRRKEQGRLDPEESDRLLRVSRVFAKALELFEGDAEAARRWFHTPAKALGGDRPISLAGTDLGSREVEALIGRLEHGVFT